MIDEKKLIEVLKKHFDADYGEDGRLLYSDHVCTSDDVEDIIKLVEEQPRVGEWTPCSLMLPKKHEHVLMTWKCGEYYHTTEAVYEDNGWLHYCPKNLPSDIEVIAWMPLPEPYEEGE